MVRIKGGFDMRRGIGFGRRAMVQREWTVTLTPTARRGEPITVKKVVAFTADLAMQEAVAANPGYIGINARATKIVD